MILPPRYVPYFQRITGFRFTRMPNSLARETHLKVSLSLTAGIRESPY